MSVAIDETGNCAVCGKYLAVGPYETRADHVCYIYKANAPTDEQIAEGEAVFADEDGTRGVMDLNGWPVVDGKKAVRALAAAYVQRDDSRAECETLRCRIVQLEEQAERARKLFVDYRGKGTGT